MISREVTETVYECKKNPNSLNYGEILEASSRGELWGNEKEVILNERIENLFAKNKWYKGSRDRFYNGKVAA